MTANELQSQPISQGLGVFGNREQFELIARVAKAFSQSTMIPQAYQNNPANCLIALNMSDRMNTDPIMVMQNLHIIKGKPGWSSQFLIAAVNNSQRFTPLKYNFVGTSGQDDFGCYVTAEDLKTGEKITGTTVTITMAKAEGWVQKTGSKWQTMPELMLQYRASAFFIRVHAPEVAMGIHTTDEVRDFIDVQPVEELVTTQEPNRMISEKQAQVQVETIKDAFLDEIQQKTLLYASEENQELCEEVCREFGYDNVEVVKFKDFTTICDTIKLKVQLQNEKAEVIEAAIIEEDGFDMFGG